MKRYIIAFYGSNILAKSDGSMRKQDAVCICVCVLLILRELNPKTTCFLLQMVEYTEKEAEARKSRVSNQILPLYCVSVRMWKYCMLQKEE